MENRAHNKITATCTEVSMIKDVNWYNVAYGTQCLHVTTNNTHIIVKQAGRWLACTDYFYSESIWAYI